MTRRVNVRVRGHRVALLLPRLPRIKFTHFIFVLFFTEVIAEEAIYAFDLNGGLFTLLRAPSNLKSASQAPAKAPLGNPSTPPPTEKYSPLQLSTSSPAEKEKAYSMSTILTVLLAVGLAHFVLVVGGFTGARGFSKLETVQERVAAYFGLG